MVLDDVRSMHNVCSVFRTADAFALEKIWLCGITGQPPHRGIEKTALGATNSVSWQHSRDAGEALTALRKEDYRLIALEQAAASIPFQAVSPKAGEKDAFIFGTEVHGVGADSLERANGKRAGRERGGE